MKPYKFLSLAKELQVAIAIEGEKVTLLFFRDKDSDRFPGPSG